MLAAVERRTQHLLDSGGPGEATRPRYSPGGEASTLSQKSKDLDEWLRFLHKAGMPFRSLGDIEQGHLDVSGGIFGLNRVHRHAGGCVDPHGQCSQHHLGPAEGGGGAFKLISSCLQLKGLRAVSCHPADAGVSCA